MWLSLTGHHQNIMYCVMVGKALFIALFLGICLLIPISQTNAQQFWQEIPVSGDFDYPPYSLAAPPLGKTIFVISHSGKTVFRQIPNGEWNKVYQGAYGLYNFTAIAANDKGLVVVSDNQGTLHYSAQNGNLGTWKTFQKPENFEAIEALAFLPDGSLLVGGSDLFQFHYHATKQDFDFESYQNGELQSSRRLQSIVVTQKYLFLARYGQGLFVREWSNNNSVWKKVFICEGDPKLRISALAANEKEVVVGTPLGVFYKKMKDLFDFNVKWTPVNRGFGQDDLYIHSLALDQIGNIIATIPSIGIYRSFKGNQWVQINNGLPSSMQLKVHGFDPTFKQIFVTSLEHSALYQYNPDFPPFFSLDIERDGNELDQIVHFSVPMNVKVSLTVSDASGKQLEILWNKPANVGRTKFAWNVEKEFQGKPLLLIMKAGETELVKKFTIDPIE